MMTATTQNVKTLKAYSILIGIITITVALKETIIKIN